MTDIDAALEQQVLHIPQRQREADVHHHHQADDLWRRVEAPERTWRQGSRFAGHSSRLAKLAYCCHVGLTEPRREFTPLLGKSFLTPLYDRAIGLFTREKCWRRKIIQHLHLVPGDRVVDVGSGTGTLLKAMMTDCPEAGLIGVEPDPAALALARRKFGARADLVKWHNGFLGSLDLSAESRPNKIVSSLVLHQVPLREKQAILENIESLLAPGGTVIVADYMLQESFLMRGLFRTTVQSLDGVEDTQSNADGEVEKLLGEIFAEPRLLDRISTVTGTISLWRGYKKGIAQ